ncbi:scavenger receptor class B member 1-like isoform X1 [Hetaerina americana]|uniref:scavenger receptor class B member 1-like isoform X1 n=1 Tax=Hetaerina americana TaxID=62018 RepID=UPI003A7F198E
MLGRSESGEEGGEGSRNPVMRAAAPPWMCFRRKAGAEEKQKNAILVLFCASCFAFVGAVLLWTTDVVNSLILSGLVIENNTQLFEWWRAPPVDTIFKLRVFNYTNSEAYLNGTDKKLRLQELGPYIYKSRRSKAYVEFDEGGEIVTFQENRTYEFLPEESRGFHEDDPVVVPNMALLGAASVMHDAHYVVRVGLGAVLQTLSVEPFLRLRVGEFFWGYDDPLFDIARTIVPSLSDVPFDRFGVMASLNGISNDRVSIHTGLKNRSTLGVIAKFNGEDSLPYWNDYECNRVDGSEGTIFPLLALPPIDVGASAEDAARHRLTVFNYELCRRFPLEPTEEVRTHDGIPAIRFRPPPGVFDDARRNPAHKCFCDPEESTCPPSGVFNATPCAYGAPIMASFPHFYMGDESLLEPFEGLNPKKELHEFTLDIQPILGVPLGGVSRLQLNAMVRISKGIWQLNGFPKNLILPIAWFELGVEELPNEVKSAIKMATQTSQLVQQGLKWMLLLSSIVLMLIVIALVLKKPCADCRKKKRGKLVLVSDHGKQESMAFLDRTHLSL